ncbi:MAG: VOC family protein [Alphaproteobacteria bacterium]|nr:VOC family protein [Alphaproteobacteria bacterium]
MSTTSHTAIAGIDHVIIGVRDLERARAGWRRLGFTLTPRGRHIGQGTANYCIMFENDFVELLGIVDPSDHVEHLAAFLAAREGARAVAFSPAGSAEDTRSALLERGFDPSELRALGRQMELPEGSSTPRFSLVSLAAEDTPGLPGSFVCAHLTPDLMRRTEWLIHANSANRLIGIHVLVENTAPLLPAYDRLFGIQHVTTTDTVATVHAGRHQIVFSTPDDFVTMHPKIDLDPDFPLPGIVAIDLGITRTEATADYFRQQQIIFAEMPDGSLAIPASSADGAILFFSER